MSCLDENTLMLPKCSQLRTLQRVVCRVPERPCRVVVTITLDCVGHFSLPIPWPRKQLYRPTNHKIHSQLTLQEVLRVSLVHCTLYAQIKVRDSRNDAPSVLPGKAEVILCAPEPTTINLQPGSWLQVLLKYRHVNTTKERPWVLHRAPCVMRRGPSRLLSALSLPAISSRGLSTCIYSSLWANASADAWRISL